jgi:hypothetical protein
MKFSRSVYVKAAVVALAMAAAGTATVAQARSDVFFSVGANVAPGVSIGVSNAPYYPAYYPQPVYVQPQPVYVQPAPIYVPQPVYYGYGYGYARPAAVVGVNYYYGPQWRHRGGYWQGQGHRGHDGDHRR